MSKGDIPDIAKLQLEEPDEDLFASPDSGANPQKHTPSSNASSARKQQPVPKQSKQDQEDARNAQLQAELEKVREVNRVIEGVTASLTKAKGNMETVNKTVNDASTLLATWTRILSQTEHNQRLILDPQWQGATRDVEDMENEEARKEQEAERRAMEEQRRREEAQRKAEEEERKKAAVEEKRARAGLSRTRSTRGTSSSTRGTAGTTGRGRGLTANTRGTSSYGRVSSSTRGRGRGLG